MLNFKQIDDKKCTSQQSIALVHALLGQLDFKKGTEFKLTKDTIVATTPGIPFPYKSGTKDLLSEMVTEYKKDDIVSIVVFNRSNIQAP